MKSFGEGFKTVPTLEYNPANGTLTESTRTIGSPTTTRPRGDGFVEIKDQNPQPIDPKR